MSSERETEVQTLERIVTELRELPTPDLNWDRVETRLLAEPKPRAPTALDFFARLRIPAAALVAVTAVGFLVVSHQAHSPVAVSKPIAQLPSGPLDGDALALGTRVTAGNQGLVVEHTGRARWTLDAHATATVTNKGEFLTVGLESGALSASVVPQPQPETFAVEVGGTRVAVHGTAFRVQRVADRVLVEVTEGTVAVEPISTHSEPSFLLRRGSRGSFGLDGISGSVEGNASVATRSSGPESHREIAQGVAPKAARGASTSAASVAAPRPTHGALPQEPSISEIENGVSKALELMNRCFRDKARSTDIRVSASTSMTLSVTGDGTVRSVTFGPPLAPAVEDCGVAGLRDLTFARSLEGATFTRLIELKR